MPSWNLKSLKLSLWKYSWLQIFHMAGMWGNAHIKIGSYYAERWSTWHSKPSRVWLWTSQARPGAETLLWQITSPSKHYFLWFMLMTDAPIRASNIRMDPPTKLTLTSGKQSKAKYFQQCETSLFVHFLSVSHHISFRHTNGASNSCKLCEKPINAEVALGSPDCGHQQQLLRTSLDFVLTLKHRLSAYFDSKGLYHVTKWQICF